VPRRPPLGPLAVSLALVLAACSGGAPKVQSQSWTGTTTSADVSSALVLATTLAPTGAWMGTYTVDRAPPFTGALDATFSGGALEGVLVVSDECGFALAGTVTGDTLAATFSPTSCPGGVGGTWAATLVATTPGATPPDPTHGDATFDGAATFDDARFR
jgi:hypothetical protein